MSTPLEVEARIGAHLGAHLAERRSMGAGPGSTTFDPDATDAMIAKARSDAGLPRNLHRSRYRPSG